MSGMYLVSLGVKSCARGKQHLLCSLKFFLDMHPLHETHKSTRARITYDGPIVGYLIYDNLD
jgi:hypothetical protein